MARGGVVQALRAEAERRVPANERVMSFILAQMDAGELRPGDRVNAARVAESVGLSITPVREALGQLAGRGVLDLLPDRGAVVTAMSPQDVRQLFTVVGAIATTGLEAAAEAVAQGSDTTALVRLYEAIAAWNVSEAPFTFYDLTIDWHWEANRIGGNPYVSRALERMGVNFWTRFLLRLIDIPGNIEGYHANYRRIHDAVMAGDAPSAAAAMRFHTGWSIALIEHAAAPGVRRRKVSARKPAS
jgi:DNA-binding GntR family transcriptional regulator